MKCGVRRLVPFLHTRIISVSQPKLSNTASSLIGFDHPHGRRLLEERQQQTAHQWVRKQRIRIVFVGMIADLVREVGGEHVQVTQLMGSGVDPHLYKPNRDDIRILDSDLVFFAGHHLEGKIPIHSAGKAEKRSFDCQNN